MSSQPTSGVTLTPGGKPFAWSYSSLQAFETCPWRWKLTKLTKEVQEPQSAATTEGNRAHKALENAVMGKAALPSPYQAHAALVERIRRTPGRIEAERKIALTADFRETTYFGKDVWFRGVFDVRVACDERTTVLDWKTGKRKPDADQLKLFAAVEFTINAVAERVDTGYVWLQSQQLDKESFSRSDAPIIWQEFAQRVARVEHAIRTNNFPKRPSGLCREWCPVGRRLCEHCGG